MKKIKFTALFLASILTGCAGQLSDSSHVTTGKIYQPTDTANISILFEEPNKEFTVIGLVESHGKGLTKSKEDERSINAIKEEAASIGADAVIITSSKVEALTGFDGDPAGEEKVLSGKAIKYK